MSLLHRTEPNFKPPKVKNGTAEGRKHMSRVASLPCVCCGYWPVSVHHCISGRYGSRKAPDTETIPLCFNHHQGPEGIHTDKSAWEAKYGKDHEYLDSVKDQLDGQFNSPWRRK